MAFSVVKRGMLFTKGSGLSLRIVTGNKRIAHSLTFAILDF